ncbi:MAG: SpoIID/LytB domain-containing protein [Lachnospiraceae bacterium]
MRRKIKTGFIIYLFVAVLPFLVMALCKHTSSLEKQVLYIVLAQVSPEAEEEAIKAQAIIARTNLVRSKRQEEEPPEAISEKDMASFLNHDQYAILYKKVKRCVDATAGKILIWKKKPAYAPYHAVSAGVTRDSRDFLQEEYPYLVSVSCKTDISSEQYLTIRYFNKEEFPESAEILKQSTGGYVDFIKVEGEKITGEEFRRMYQFHSSCFSITQMEDGIRVITKGWGHGLGLSQYTANQMAKKGRSYEEILTYFYKGIKIENSANTMIREK